MSVRCIVLVAVGCTGLHHGHAQASIEALIENQSAAVQRLFDALDLEAAPLSAVRSMVEAGNWAGACNALLDHYRDGDTAAWLRNPARLEPAAETLAAADAVLEDTFTFYGVTERAPRRADGGLDWDYRGPGDDREWAWALNRHYHLDDLLDAYLMTGDAKYAAAWDAHVRDWVMSNPYPGEASSSASWRGLEAFFRMRAWSRGFYALQHEAAFSPSTRILLLASVPDHAHYLRHFHKASSNWIVMELRGLTTAALAWPEFAGAESWVAYSTDRLTRELTAQVYPDGAQMELTATYHRVTLVNFEAFSALLQAADRDVPPGFDNTVERMWTYLAYSMQPSGHGPLNNDSDLEYVAPRIIEKAERFNRPDWRFIASHGAEGTAPEGLPSRVFPWAGQLIMRSGWDAQAQWAFFDAGPMGTGHRHADKLHLSVSAHGRDLLVDGGRYTYVGGPWRRYFTGSASHNVILVDDAGQLNHPFTTDAPADTRFVTAPEFDLGYGVFDSGYEDVDGDVTHERLVFYRRDSYWLVLDRVTTDRPRNLTALWHFHPKCNVVLDARSVFSDDPGEGNVRITPSDGIEWQRSIVKGQEEPHLQGWWSRRYNEKTPAPVAVYETHIESTAVFAWLLWPGVGGTPEGRIALTTNDDGTLTCVVIAGVLIEPLRITFTDPPAVRILPNPVRQRS